MDSLGDIEQKDNEDSEEGTGLDWEDKVQMAQVDIALRVHLVLDTDQCLEGIVLQGTVLDLEGIALNSGKDIDQEGIDLEGMVLY